MPLPPSVAPRREYHDRIGDGDNSAIHDSSYDSNFEDEEGILLSKIRDQDHRFKFGTEMPSTVDLRSAIESCDALCKFALHYSGHAGAPHDKSRGQLDPEMQANLQKIRSMNTIMLIGLQNMPRSSDKSENAGAAAAAAGVGERYESEAATQPSTGGPPPPPLGRTEREHSPLRFGYGPPSSEMVHELAKVATSIFQLAIRIKAWVSMTPEERELDEEINLIRGKRCLLMDSALAAAKVDQHGNVQKDWTVVPAASSTNKTFYERQREIEQRRLSTNHPQNPKHSQQQQQHPQNFTHDQSQMDSDRTRIGTDNERSPYKRVDSSSTMVSLATSPLGYGFSGAVSSSFTSDSNIRKPSREYMSFDNRSSHADINIRNSKNGDASYQKYRKRAKRTQPPGRCLSCDSSDTPEWRRGPDGARPPAIKSRATVSRVEQLQTSKVP
ncbi:hypothetical protein BGZ58_002691, partial [Dissophora ornata]